MKGLFVFIKRAKRAQMRDFFFGSIYNRRELRGNVFFVVVVVLNPHCQLHVRVSKEIFLQILASIRWGGL